MPPTNLRCLLSVVSADARVYGRVLVLHALLGLLGLLAYLPGAGWALFSASHNYELELRALQNREGR